LASQRGGVSRNKHAISKRDRERIVRERRTRKLAEKREKAAEHRDVQAREPATHDSSAQ
jgi:hypothetical protein